MVARSHREDGSSRQACRWQKSPLHWRVALGKTDAPARGYLHRLTTTPNKRHGFGFDGGQESLQEQRLSDASICRRTSVYPFPAAGRLSAAPRRPARVEYHDMGGIGGYSHQLVSDGITATRRGNSYDLQESLVRGASDIPCFLNGSGLAESEAAASSTSDVNITLTPSTSICLRRTSVWRVYAPPRALSRPVAVASAREQPAVGGELLARIDNRRDVCHRHACPLDPSYPMTAPP